MKISVSEAQIRTAQVEVKALTISGRQVTMALFRQLETEPLINPDCSLAGIPWGWVNYFPPPCQADHLHIVWQKGEELRRACVRENIPRTWIEEHLKRRKLAAWRVMYARAFDDPSIYGAAATFSSGYYRPDHVEFEYMGVTVWLEEPAWKEYIQVSQRLSQSSAGELSKWQVEQFNQNLAAARDSLAERRDQIDLDNEEDALKQTDGAIEAATEKYSETVAALKTLPQLFIAV